MAGQRGRLVNAPDRIAAVALIEEAVHSGARKWKACETIGINIRTLQRWIEERCEVKKDGRKGAVHPKSANKLSEEERIEILSVVNTEEYRSMPR